MAIENLHIAELEQEKPCRLGIGGPAFFMPYVWFFVKICYLKLREITRLIWTYGSFNPAILCSVRSYNHTDAPLYWRR